jgi:lipid II isoglutaminyl synthase (glutamine-hydrolysing)
MKTVHIVQLYPKEMNIYGDMGNQLIMAKRLEWREIPHKVSFVGVGDKVPTDANLVLGGGGQDTGQLAIEADLQTKAADLKALAEAGVPMLMVCGLYQLFGHRFVTHQGTDIKGIGLFDLETRASHDRLIGNITVETEWGRLVGYENHSGKTYLGSGVQSFGRVVRGAGNNNEDHQEGARTHNAFGTYMHGPLLSKNPEFADVLLDYALQTLGEDENVLSPLDDEFAVRAANIAATRPR